MINTYYRSNTKILTNNGMVHVSDIKDGDEVFYLDKDNNLKKTKLFSIVKSKSNTLNVVNGKYLHIEYFGDLVNYKGNEIMKCNYSNSYNLKIANLDDVYSRCEFDKNSTNVIVDLNNTYYEVNNLKGLMFCYIIESFYNYADNIFTLKQSINKQDVYHIHKCFYDYSGIFIDINSNNISEYASKKYNMESSRITQYFLRNLTYFSDFINTMIDAGIINSNNKRHTMYFGKYKLASDFQALLSLIGYKTSLKFDKSKSMFSVYFFNITGSLVTTPKQFDVVDIDNEEFYNIYIYNEEICRIITQSHNDDRDTCIYYGLSAIKEFEDNSYNTNIDYNESDDE